MEMKKEYEAPANAPSVITMLALLTGLSLFLAAAVFIVFSVSEVLP